MARRELRERMVVAMNARKTSRLVTSTNASRLLVAVLTLQLGYTLNPLPQLQKRRYFLSAETSLRFSSPLTSLPNVWESTSSYRSRYSKARRPLSVISYIPERSDGPTLLTNCFPASSESRSFMYCLRWSRISARFGAVCRFPSAIAERTSKSVGFTSFTIGEVTSNLLKVSELVCKYFTYVFGRSHPRKLSVDGFITQESNGPVRTTEVPSGPVQNQKDWCCRHQPSVVLTGEPCKKTSARRKKISQTGARHAIRCTTPRLVLPLPEVSRNAV